MSSSTATLKARHYTALSSRLRQLQNNLGESEAQLDAMALRLQDMARLGVSCGSQFMAVSRLLDEELQAAQAGTGTGTNDNAHGTEAEPRS